MRRAALSRLPVSEAFQPRVPHGAYKPPGWAGALESAPHRQPGKAALRVLAFPFELQDASRRPYLRISGQISATAMTTRIVPSPPETTENTGPNQ